MRIDPDIERLQGLILVARRAALQLRTDPFAFGQALAWRALRRPAVGYLDGLRRRPESLRLTESKAWAQTVLDLSTPVPDWVVEATLRADLVVFGRAFRGDVPALLRADGRFALEKLRAQAIHPLLAALWHGGLEAGLRERVEAHVVRELAGAAETSAHGYPMDGMLQGLGIVLSLTAAGAGRLVLAPQIESRLLRRLGQIIGRCFADPEYSGRLSNNHHLSCVAGLLVLAASVEDSPRIDRIRRAARRWLREAVAVQFGADGAQFEASSGYHMCCLEALALAVLADPETAADETIGAVLPKAQRFACALVRDDGSYPLIGDFDASRILRLCNRYRSEPPAETDCAIAGVPGCRIGVRSLDHANSDAVPAFVARLPIAWVSSPSHPVRAGVAIEPHAPSPTVVPAADSDRRLLEGLRGDGWPAFASFVRYDFGEGFEAFGSIESFDDIGIVVARTPGAHLTMRSGRVGQRGIGTHSHLDTLALDVWTASGPRASDPGTAAYLSRADLRRRFRSAAAHFTPLWTRELASLAHPFALLTRPPEARLFSRPGLIGGVAFVGGDVHLRVATVDAGRLIVLDAASGAPLVPYPFPEDCRPVPTYLGALDPDRRSPHPRAARIDETSA